MNFNEEFKKYKYIRIVVSYTSHCFQVSEDGQNWYSLSIEDEILVEMLPVDLYEMVKLYERFSKDFIWSDLYYHAESNALMCDSDCPAHFWYCIFYLEDAIVAELKKYYPEKEISRMGEWETIS